MKLSKWSFLMYLLVAAAMSLLPLLVRADWINLSGAENAPTIAEITVYEDRVDVSLEVFVGEIDKFLTEDHTGLLISADGVSISPRVLVSEERRRKDRYSPYAGMVDPRTRRRVPGPPEDKRVLYLELEYEMLGRPEQITISPPLTAEGDAATTIGMLVYHRSAPVIDFRYLSQPEVLRIDWDDPWYTAFENTVLTRHHRWPQMSFLYIEPREVRHEVLLRVRDLVKWTQGDAEEWGSLTTEQQTALKAAAIRFSAEHNLLHTDGRLVTASASRAEYLNIDPTGLQVVEEGEVIDASSGILGISHSYWTEKLPARVTVEWELFDERVDSVPSTVTDPAGPFPGYVSREFPTIEWENFLQSYEDPVVRQVSTATDSLLDWSGWRTRLLGMPDKESAAEIVRKLLENFSAAYFERDPRQLDETLKQLVGGDATDDVKVELARAFAIPTRGGGLASVEAVAGIELGEVAPANTGEGFSVMVDWVASATGRHWGHVDNRYLRTRALMDVAQYGDVWKLSGLTVLDIKPLDAGTGAQP